jgi:hypothetical protein
MKQGSLKGGTFYWIFIKNDTNTVMQDPCKLKLRYLGKVCGVEMYKIISITAKYTDFIKGELHFDTINDCINICFVQKLIYDATKTHSISAFLQKSKKVDGRYYGAIVYTSGLEGDGGYAYFKAKTRKDE